MKNLFKIRRFAICGLNQSAGLPQVGLKIFVVLVLSLAVMSGGPHLVSQAQKSHGPNRVWNVAEQPAGNGTMVSIAADSPVGRAQNWQDSEGYHIVLPNTVAADSLKTIRGVKVRRIGTSLELLFQTKPGSNISVQAEGNEITVVADRKLETTAAEPEARTASRAPKEKPVPDYSKTEQQWRRDAAPLNFSTPGQGLAVKSQPRSGETAQTSSTWNPPIGPTSALPAPALPERAAAPQPSAEVSIQPDDEGALASIFSATSVFIVITLGLFGLLVSRKLRSRQALVQSSEVPLSEDAEWVENETPDGRIRVRRELTEPGEALVRSNGSALAGGPARQSGGRLTVAGPTTLFGAYRIDQEVGKLVLGQPHRMDVLASRASDDRRAIETSLIKGVNAPDFDDDARRRAREALQEYGFVARLCAALLLAPDPFERTSAARSLGEIKSEAALPFLLESLYDSESIVRNQAVLSIGELKLPSAIGALLDIARTHPDVPSSLLSRTLSACSVEGLDFFDAMPIDPAQLGMGHEVSVVDQITHLEPASSVEELPEDSDDEQQTRALFMLGSVDVQERAEALKVLGQFRVKSSVDAISQLVRHDPEPNLRAMAITGLGAIDHESVFAAILIGMADESREVRAAAARALSRLNFERADAFVRVIETSDEETIRKVASACIETGIVSQNIDRLASSDYRQAYETFALICLLAKADLHEPILDAVARHENSDVRLKAVHLLAATGQPGMLEHLRQLAVRDGVSEEVKTALLEAMYKLDQDTKRKEKDALEAVDAAGGAHFSGFAAATLQTDNAEDGFDFAFETVTEPDSQPETEAEREPNLDEFEL